MFKNLLIGVDEHEGGRDAIALARELVAEDGELTLAYVHGGYPVIARGSSDAFEASERERAREILEKARGEAGIDAQLRCIGETSVGRGLHMLAERIHADLIVVGSSRRGLLGRVFLGDDTRAALDGAPCAVAIAPAGYTEHPKVMREIGVAYNGSPESVHALAVGRTLAAETSAKLSAFEAVAVPTYAFFGAPSPISEVIDLAVKEALDRISALGGVEAHAVYGYPVEELAVYSASLDLLVVGSRDYGPVGRLVHGSTTHHLARSARCPLLILTRAARAAEPHADADDLAGAPS